MQECLPLQRAIGKWRSSHGNAMGVASEHEVKELASGSAKTGVEIGTNNVVGSRSSGGVDSSSGEGDDCGDSNK